MRTCEPILKYTLCDVPVKDRHIPTGAKRSSHLLRHKSVESPPVSYCSPGSWRSPAAFRWVRRESMVGKNFEHLCRERGIRTPKPLREPVFKTGTIAALPALRGETSGNP
jgi:hypothetical protein